MTPFLQTVANHIKTEEIIGVEIGVMEGINALYLLEEPRIKRLYLIDNYKAYFSGSNWFTQDQQDKYYLETIKKMEQHFGRVRFIVKDSIWAATIFPDQFFDFIYIDAGHAYTDVMIDMITWWPKCKTRGVFGGHDYGTVNGLDVKRAVDDFMKIHNIEGDPSIGMRVGEAMEWAIVKP